MNEALGIFDRAGGLVLNRHLQLQSGKHASGYINADAVFPFVLQTNALGTRLAEPFVHSGVDVVIAPAVGGIVWANFVALYISQCTGAEVMVVWVENIGNDSNGAIFGFTRIGFSDMLRSRNVLVVDDVMSNANEMGTVFKVCRIVEQHGGNIVGVSLIANRCEGTALQLHVPRLHSLADVQFDAWKQEECPLCAEAVPMITNVGHGDKFQEQHPDYPGGFEVYVPTKS